MSILSELPIGWKLYIHALDDRVNIRIVSTNNFQNSITLSREELQFRKPSLINDEILEAIYAVVRAENRH